MDPADVDTRLSKIEGKLDEIAQVIGTIAVQQAKIDRIEARVRDAEVRHEQLCTFWQQCETFRQAAPVGRSAGYGAF